MGERERENNVPCSMLYNVDAKEMEIIKCDDAKDKETLGRRRRRRRGRRRRNEREGQTEREKERKRERRERESRIEKRKKEKKKEGRASSIRWSAVAANHGDPLFTRRARLTREWHGPAGGGGGDMCIAFADIILVRLSDCRLIGAGPFRRPRLLAADTSRRTQPKTNEPRAADDPRWT